MPTRRLIHTCCIPPLLTHAKRFRYCEKLGFLGTCPSNLGTGLRASVMIKLAKFNETEESREVLEQVRENVL